MCYNVVQYHDYSCGDYSVVRQQRIDCNNKDCTFSRMHETVLHDCESTCKQMMLPDQGIITYTHDGGCPRCTGRTNGHGH